MASSSSLLSLNDGIKRRPLGITLIFLAPALGGFLYGFDIGASNFVLSLLKNEKTASSSSSTDSSNVQVLHWGSLLNDSIQIEGLVVAAVSLGALIGTLTVHWLTKSISRRLELRTAAILYIVGSSLCWVSGNPACLTNFWTVLSRISSHGQRQPSDDYRWIGALLLTLGRATFGFGVGFVKHSAPTYLSEMAPTRIRGVLLSMNEATLVLGIILGNAAGYMLRSLPERWTHPYEISVAIGFFMLMLTFIVPRSYRWLLTRGDDKEALDSLNFVLDGEGVLDKFERTRVGIRRDLIAAERARQSRASLLSRVTKMTPHQRQIRWAYSIGLGLITFQQISGQPSMISYVEVTFRSIGMDDNASILVACFMICFNLTAALLVDRVGRKKLLYTGTTLMAIAAATLCLVFYGLSPNDMDSSTEFQKAIMLVAMLLYIGAYQLSFGPITWLVMSEVFPIDARGEAVATCVIWNYTLNFLLQFAVPLFQELLGMSGTFALFAITCSSSVFFIYKKVPETKGLTLEEVGQLVLVKSTADLQGVGTVDQESDHLLGDKRSFSDVSMTSNHSDEIPSF